MSEARWIICEKSGSWATALRSRLSATGIRVYETRSLAECWRELERNPRSIVGLDLTAENVPALLRFLARMRRWFPQAQAVVLAGTRGRPYEWLLREAGAIHFVRSTGQLRPLVGLVQRHLRANQDADDDKDDDEVDFTRVIWERLPWPASSDAHQERTFNPETN